MSVKERRTKESRTVETGTTDVRDSGIALLLRKGDDLVQGPGRGPAAPGSAAHPIGPTETDLLCTEGGEPGARIEAVATTAGSPATTSKIARRSEPSHQQLRQKRGQDRRSYSVLLL